MALRIVKDLDRLAQRLSKQCPLCYFLPCDFEKIHCLSVWQFLQQ